MAYKILYIEDLDPGTIVHDLKLQGFETEHYSPNDLGDLLTKAKDFDLLLLDFRLTENKKAVYDAPTIAQTVRTTGGRAHLDIPIVLISSEKKISDYYKDYSSQDLFDFSVAKEVFLKEMPKHALRFNSVIEAYKTVTSNKKNVLDSLKISADKLKTIDYRVAERLNSEIYKNDVFAFNNFVLNQIIRSIGILIGEDVLSARLGVSKKSPDWKKLLEKFNEFKYGGIYSSAYDRWWSDDLEAWWKSENEGGSLRRLSAEQRVGKISKITNLNSLIVQEKTKHASSSYYWTICRHSKNALDSIDGLELHQRDLLPWQEKEYISLQAGLESSPLFQYVKPIDKERLRTINKAMKS